MKKQKNINYYLFAAVVFAVLFAINQFDLSIFDSQEKESATVDNPSKSIDEAPFDTNVFYPSSTTGQIVTHDTYTLSYHEAHEQAEWVAYWLTPDHISGGEHKRPYFNQDPKVSTESADWRNYKNSGYTRGHLLPAGDRTFDKAAYDETFFTSNISPQKYEFNTGIWNSLEMTVRNFVRKNGEVFVVTGGVLSGNLKTIGTEKVSVPDYFYKIIFFEDGQNSKIVAYLMPHEEKNRQSLSHYVVSVDSLEQLTQIDFFSQLPDDLENSLEQTTSSRWFTHK